VCGKAGQRVFLPLNRDVQPPPFTPAEEGELLAVGVVIPVVNVSAGGVVEGDICSHIPQGIDQRWIEIIFAIIAVIINIISIFFRIELFLLRAFRRLQFLDDGDLIVTVGENLGAGPPNAARPVDIGDQEIAVVDDDVGAKFRQVFPKSIQGRFVHG